MEVNNSEVVIPTVKPNLKTNLYTKKMIGRKSTKSRRGKKSKKTFVREDEAMCGKTSRIPVSSVTLGHSRASICCVSDYPKVQVYDTNTHGKFTYHVANSGNLEVSDPNESNRTPALHQLESIAENMVKTNVLELKWSRSNSNFYDYDGVIRLKEIVKCKMISDYMEGAKKFLFYTSVPELSSFSTPISQKHLEDFWDSIYQVSPNSRLVFNGKSVASESLCSLMSEDCTLSDEVLDQICSILNENSEMHRTVTANLKHVNENANFFISRIKQMFGNLLSNVNIILYMDVENYGASEDNSLQAVSRHYVFGIYNLNENTVLYVDTLAKPIPKSLFTSFVKLSQELGKEAIYFGLCHEEKASLKHDECREDCSYPYQMCVNVGGIAAIIGMSIFTLDRKIFLHMTGQQSHESYADKVSYLRDISPHSHFLRLVVINWIMAGTIDLSQIYKKAKAQKNHNEFVHESNSLMRRSDDVTITEFSGTIENLPGSQVSSVEEHKETSVYDRKNDVKLDCPMSTQDSIIPHDSNEKSMLGNRCTEKSKTSRIKEKIDYQSKSHTSNDTKFLSLKVRGGRFHISFEEIHDLLNDIPTICFKKKLGSYCVECQLTTGLKKYKFFKCSHEKGRDDRNVLHQLRELFTRSKFMEWVNDEMKPDDFESRIINSVKLEKHGSDVYQNVTVLNKSRGSITEKKANDDSKNDLSANDRFRSSSLPSLAVEDKPRPSLAKDLCLPSPPEREVLNNKAAVKYSKSNTVKVGCKQGRIPVYFGEVQHLLIGRPILAYRKKKCCYSLECTFYNGITGYRNFNCNKRKGRDDLDTLNRISDFLKLEMFTEWMKENLKKKPKNRRKTDKCCDTENDVSGDLEFEGCSDIQAEEENIVVIKKDTADPMEICMEISDSGAVDKFVTSGDSTESDCLDNTKSINYERIREFIVGKPKIHFRKLKNIYRVECLLWNGKKVHKNFVCSSTKKEDTLEEIKKFLLSDKAVNWVQNYDDSWIFQYEVKAGIETRRCLDKIPFDMTKHFIYYKDIIKPEYCKETCWVSVTENKKWGKTHRYDETYRIISSTSDYHPSTVVAYIYLSCASKTNECRSLCGALLSSLTCQDNVCDHCGESLDTGRECSHCKTTTSSQWYHKGEPGELCTTCYTYKRRKGCDRPIECKSNGGKRQQKIHHEHLQCQWKMKLEMKLDNLNTWNVYESSENINYHVSVPLQEKKRPALGIRDMWDKLRMSKKASSIQIHAIESKSKSFISSKDASSSEATHSISQIKARCELVDKHNSGNKSRNEPYQMVINEEEHHIENETLIQTSQNQHQSPRQLQLEASKVNHTRICGICFEEGVNPPFTCNTKRDLDAHKNKVHNGYGDLCALCYKEMGMVVRFEDNRELMQHLNKHKIKYNKPEDSTS